MTLAEEIFQHLLGTSMVVRPSLSQLFGKYFELYPKQYIAYKLSAQNVAALIHVDVSTIRKWVRNKKLKSRLSRTRIGNLYYTYRRFCLKDVADFLVKYGREYNEVENTTWTPQEVELLKRGIRPEGRSRLACRCKKCRLRKEGQL